MDHIESLPKTNDVLSPTMISLFGILCPPAEKGRVSLLSRNNDKRTISCVQTTVLRALHSHRMFQDWALLSHTESTVRCAYCKTTYPYEDTCFLCLQEYAEILNCTTCCHTKVHSEFISELAALLSLLSYDHSSECGQLTNCNRLWVHI